MGSSQATETSSGLGGSVKTLSSTNSDLNRQIKAIDLNSEEKRKSARRKEFIMAELLETERAYVLHLTQVVDYFMKPMLNECREMVPAPLR